MNGYMNLPYYGGPPMQAMPLPYYGGAPPQMIHLKVF